MNADEQLFRGCIRRRKIKSLDRRFEKDEDEFQYLIFPSVKFENKFSLSKVCKQG